MNENNPKSLLVLYDGVCALCHRVVTFLLRIDRARKLQFAPLQGKTARHILSRHPRLGAGTDTVVLVQQSEEGEETVHLCSAAILHILEQMGGIWRLLSWCRLIPRPIRDWAYDVIASRRYRWFGKYDICRIPSGAEAGRFLE
ncbi:MAG: thiol-disulfide oxidoreductase DCC family protein [bacterium]